MIVEATQEGKKFEPITLTLVVETEKELESILGLTGGMTLADVREIVARSCRSDTADVHLAGWYNGTIYKALMGQVREAS